MKFRKKPVVVDAFQYEEQDFCFFPDWAIEGAAWLGGTSGGYFVKYYKDNALEKLCVKTLEGEMLVSVGDWIIKGVKGEIYPCKPDIFEMTYEAVE